MCAADGAGPVCDGVPGDPEGPDVCSLVDDDCDGATDEADAVGGLCQAGQECRAGFCVAPCVLGRCDRDWDWHECRDGFCFPRCAGACPVGQVCDARAAECVSWCQLRP